MTDPDVKDPDDIFAALKSICAMRLLRAQNPNLHVIFHVILDCDDRILYMKVLLDMFVHIQEDVLKVEGANFEFVLYKFEVTDANRLEEIREHMDDALCRDKDFVSNQQSVDSRDPKNYPWGDLDALAILGPLFGVDPNCISLMPIFAVVTFVGDCNSVNGRPKHLFEAVQEACKIKLVGGEAVRIQSRYWGFSPTAPDKKNGMTRQCLISYVYLDALCLLYNKTKKPQFKMMIEGLGKGLRRTFVDRPDDDDFKGRGAVVRNRINVSNELTVEPVINDLQPDSCIALTIINKISQEKKAHFLKPNNFEQIKAAAIMMYELHANHIILVDSDVHLNSIHSASLNLTSLFESYCNNNQMDHPDMQHDTCTEKIAILCCILSTMSVFGNIFGPSPQICMDQKHMNVVLREIIAGFPQCKPKGKLKFFTPNYDGCVLEATLLHCVQALPLHKYIYADVDGHQIVCHQPEEVIKAYMARDEQQLTDLITSTCTSATDRTQESNLGLTRSESMVVVDTDMETVCASFGNTSSFPEHSSNANMVR